MHRERQRGERIQTCFFSNLTYHKLQLLNVQHNFCSAMFYTVLIAGLIDFIDFTNIIVLNQCITFRLIKEMPLFAFDAFLKVKIRITSFVTHYL